MTLGTRPLGMAIRNLYPLAYASWQDAIFHVNGIGPLPGIQPNQEETRKIDKELTRNPKLLKKAYLKIKENIREDLQQKIDEWEEDAEGTPVTIVNVTVPMKIDLRLDTSLDIVYCSGCHQLNRLSKIGRNPRGGLPYHHNCTKGGRFKQAPIFIPKQSGGKTIGVTGEPGAVKIGNISTRQIMCFYLGPGGTCKHPQSKDNRCAPIPEKQLAYLKINPKRPITGLRVVNENCPKELYGIPEKPLQPPRVGAGKYYMKRFPSPGISSPLFVSVASEISDHSKEIDEINSYISEIKQLLFNSNYVDMQETKFSRIRVLEMVYGVRIGGRYGGYTEHWMRGGEHNNVVGRMLNTQGFVITIKPTIYSKIDQLIQQNPELAKKPKPREYTLEVIAHTLKHAMLVLVPRFTGFEDQKFMGAYDVLENQEGAKVYLFDNENGGNGGFATLIKQHDRFSEMVTEVGRSLINCPVRECKYACGNCLFLRKCGRVNREISRKLLKKSEIFAPQM